MTFCPIIFLYFYQLFVLSVNIFHKHSNIRLFLYKSGSFVYSCSKKKKIYTCHSVDLILYYWILHYYWNTLNFTLRVWNYTLWENTLLFWPYIGRDRGKWHGQSNLKKPFKKFWQKTTNFTHLFLISGYDSDDLEHLSHGSDNTACNNNTNHSSFMVSQPSPFFQRW